MTETRSIAELINGSKRIIIKIGSAIVMENGNVKADWINCFANNVSELINSGHEIIVVTSGAIALGRKYFGISGSKPRAEISLDLAQAAAAIGQIDLISTYRDAFKVHDISVAQVLLSPHDTENRRSHLNARATINALLSQGIIPVINENDSVSTDEIKFGDNDKLAARVGQMIEADLVILLSTTDGFYTADPSVDPDAKHIPFVEHIDKNHQDMAGDAPGGVSTGGMKSKIDAARLTTNAGTAMLIADGRAACSLAGLLNSPAPKCTYFMPKGNPSGARKRWIESHIRTEGTITIDDGAVKALINGSSLLPVGVIKVEGEFDCGDAVTIVRETGDQIAIGLASFNSSDSRKIIGMKSSEQNTIPEHSRRSEMVHRNDMVISFENKP